MLAPGGELRSVDEALRADGAHHLAGAAVALAGTAVAAAVPGDLTGWWALAALPVSLIGLFVLGVWWTLARDSPWSVARARRMRDHDRRAVRRSAVRKGPRPARTGDHDGSDQAGLSTSDSSPARKRPRARAQHGRAFVSSAGGRRPDRDTRPARNDGEARRARLADASCRRAPGRRRSILQRGRPARCKPRRRTRGSTAAWAGGRNVSITSPDKKPRSTATPRRPFSNTSTSLGGTNT